jgi:multicomponent Na+:H+ antiporter subunit D
MLNVGGFCVLVGLVPELLCELLPFTGLRVEELHPCSTSHLAEGVVLLVVGFVGFFGLKEPLARIAWLPDVDRIVFPAGFYLGRYLTWGVTELWAAVDRVVMATAGASMRVGSNPGRYAYRTAERVPGVDVGELPEGHGGGTLRLRASAGLSVFLLTFALLVGLAALVFL